MALLSILDISSSALVAQSQRLNISASNMANAESVADMNGNPYQARQAVFKLSLIIRAILVVSKLNRLSVMLHLFDWNISRDIHLQMLMATYANLTLMSRPK